MPDMEPQLSPETNEQEIANKLSHLYLNSNEGDRRQNFSYISSAIALHQLKVFLADPSMEFIHTECRNLVDQININYTTVPNTLLNGVEVEGVGHVGPSDEWIRNRVSSMTAFKAASEILEKAEGLPIENIVLDTLSLIDSIESKSGEKAVKALKIGIITKESPQIHEEFVAVMGRIQERSIREQEYLRSVKKAELKQLRSSIEKDFGVTVDKESDLTKKQLLIENMKEELEHFDNEHFRDLRGIDDGVNFMVEDCIDYSILTSFAKILEELKDTNFVISDTGKEIFGSLVSTFKSLGANNRYGVYGTENEVFYEDIIEILLSTQGFDLKQFLRMRRVLDRKY